GAGGPGRHDRPRLPVGSGRQRPGRRGERPRPAPQRDRLRPPRPRPGRGQRADPDRRTGPARVRPPPRGRRLSLVPPPDPVRLDKLVWPELAGRAERSILVVPLGSTEQHGPHLPLGTDSAVAVALAERLASARPDVVVAPALPYGSAGEHAAFPGTLSIGAAALELVVVE